MWFTNLIERSTHFAPEGAEGGGGAPEAVASSGSVTPAESSPSDASGGETPAGSEALEFNPQQFQEEFGDFAPTATVRERFEALAERNRGTAQELQQAQEQLQSLQAFGDWHPLIQQLAQAQLTPEAALQALLAPPENQSDPTATESETLNRFTAWCGERGVNAENWQDLAPHQQLDMQKRFEFEDRFNQFQQTQQQAQEQQKEQAFESAVVSSVEAITRDPAFQMFSEMPAVADTLKLVGMNYGAASVPKVAQMLKQQMDAVIAKSNLAYYTSKIKNGGAPVINGGGSPNPNPALNIHMMSEDDREAFLRSYSQSQRPQ